MRNEGWLLHPVSQSELEGCPGTLVTCVVMSTVPLLRASLLAVPQMPVMTPWRWMFWLLA